MKHLVMRDIRLVSFMNLIVLIVGLIGGVVGLIVDRTYISSYAYGLVTYITWFMINVNIVGKESKIKSDAFIISMPVNKSDVVKARYLTMVIYIFGILGIMFLVSNIGEMLFNDMPGSPLTLLGILVIGAIMVILTSVYIPFQYYDQKSSTFFLVIIQLLVVGTPNIMERFGINIDDSNFIKAILELDFNIIGLISLGVALILYLLSLITSKSIYEAKEF